MGFPIAKVTRLREHSFSLHEDGPWPIDAIRLQLSSLGGGRLRMLDLLC